MLVHQRVIYKHILLLGYLNYALGFSYLVFQAPPGQATWQRERGGLSTWKKYDHPIANFVGVFSDYVESGSIAG